MVSVGLLPWAYPVRTPPLPPRGWGSSLPSGVHPPGTGLGQGFSLGGSVVRELGQAGVGRNFEWRGLKPGGPSTPLPAGCPQLGERGVGLQRTIALGWWSGIEASCPEGLPILKGCSVEPHCSSTGVHFKTPEAGKDLLTSADCAQQLLLLFFEID